MLRARILKSGAFFRYFPIWWVAEFVPLSFRFTFRVIRFIADQLSLKLVVTKFFTPWKQSYNLPGWVSGLIVKSLYLAGVLPFISLVTLGVLIMNK